MLKLVIQMLEFQKLGTSEAIDIAKGKYKLPETLKELKKSIKWQLQKR
jgi:hypothetical protein